MFASRAIVAVLRSVEREVCATQRAVVTLRFIPNGNVRLDLLLLDQPAKHRACAVSGITDQALGLKAESLVDALKH